MLADLLSGIALDPPPPRPPDQISEAVERLLTFHGDGQQGRPYWRHPNETYITEGD